MHRSYVYLFAILFIVSSAGTVTACESCTIPRLGRHQTVATDASGPRWRADFTFEQQKWEARDARDAHEIHHNGHHVHNKTHEEFAHFILAAEPNERWSLLADLPYVKRSSTEIHSHARLGRKETSDGIGDLHFLATYHAFLSGRWRASLMGGIKLPTGSTEETNSVGELFEPELQPGSGSTDVPLGGVIRWDGDAVDLRANAVYVLRSEGDQSYRFGDLFSTALFLDLPLLKDEKGWGVDLSMDLNFQHEEAPEDHGVTVEDSGGDLLLLGPAWEVKRTDALSIFGNILFPVFQDPNGFHQELDYVWNAGLKVAW